MKKSILTSLIAASAMFTGVAFAGSYSADAGYTAADTSAMAGNSFFGQGWYAGVGINRTAQNDYTVDATSTTGSTSLKADTQKIGYDVLVGKKLNDLFAVELGYNTYGTNTFTNDAGAEADFYGMWSTTVMGVVNSPAINGFSAHAKAGAAYFSENSKNTIDETTVSSSYSGANFAYGFGAQYDFKQFGVSLDWTRIAVTDNNSNFTDSSVYAPDQYSLNFLYNFG